MSGNRPEELEVNQWLDRMVRYSIEAAGNGIDSRSMLNMIHEIWADHLTEAESRMLEKILSSAEKLVHGAIQEEEWIKQMNACFQEIWT